MTSTEAPSRCFTRGFSSRRRCRSASQRSASSPTLAAGDLLYFDPRCLARRHGESRRPHTRVSMDLRLLTKSQVRSDWRSEGALATFRAWRRPRLSAAQPSSESTPNKLRDEVGRWRFSELALACLAWTDATQLRGRRRRRPERSTSRASWATTMAGPLLGPEGVRRGNGAWRGGRSRRGRRGARRGAGCRARSSGLEPRATRCCSPPESSCGRRGARWPQSRLLEEVA